MMISRNLVMKVSLRKRKTKIKNAPQYLRLSIVISKKKKRVLSIHPTIMMIQVMIMIMRIQVMETMIRKGNMIRKNTIKVTRMFVIHIQRALITTRCLTKPI